MTDKEMWVDCDKAWPEIGQVVDLWVVDLDKMNNEVHGRRHMNYTFTGQSPAETNFGDGIAITHWMPLPPKPNE